MTCHSLLAVAQEPGMPMSCAITGKVVCVSACRDKDEKSLCAKYPCRAMVEILEVSSCGSSVTHIPVTGDTVEMEFAYTLHKTKKIFPDMKERYPGLKKRHIFTANAEQRILPGNTTHFIVYDYSRR